MSESTSTTLQDDPTPAMSAAPRVVRVRPARPRRWPLIVAVAGLALLLALQLLLAQRHALAADARWRPVLEALCGALGCSLPPWREPEAFALLARSVRTDPAAPGTLVAEARFRNDARWPQPWPTVWLELSNVDGPVAARAFRPDEYRPRDAGPLIAPGQTAALRLRLVEPAPQIVGYVFDFR